MIAPPTRSVAQGTSPTQIAKHGLTPGDRDFLAWARRRDIGILADVDSNRIDPAGAVLVICPDGHQFPDIFEHKLRLYQTLNAQPCLHPLTKHGGPLRLDPRSPTNLPGRSTARDLQESVAESLVFKNLQEVGLVAHAPCLKVALCCLSASDSLVALFKAEDQLSSFLPEAMNDIRRKLDWPTREDNLSIRCYFQVDWGNGTQRSYYVPRRKFELWREQILHGNVGGAI